ncbi:MAG: hypothetical protein CMJ58_12145 [Planctomycetaceae bacterium]|nr:hypothetical protein [Planctomycetaceae bacterium]
MAAFGSDSPAGSFRSHLTHTKKRLAFESLEQRQLLAADMAEIVGHVRLDLQGDGNAANDAAVAGAQVSLYRDNGNGVLDSGDVAAASPVATDAAGRYQFGGLQAGQYLVKTSLPAGMKFAAGADVQAVTITTNDAAGAEGLTIDGFNSEQIVEARPPMPASDPASVADASVVGGERDMFVRITAGTDKYSSVSLISGGGLLRLASGSTVTGDAKLVWDGVDGAAEEINYTGLGGLDLRTDNGNTMTGIGLTVGADHPASAVSIRVYTDANNWSEFRSVVPETNGGAATSSLVFGYADATSASSGSGVDWANVGAVELTFEGVTAVDGQVSRIGLVGITNKQADFTATPTLSLGDLVWNDIDNDGMADAGESGIGGVKVKLYADTDGDNAYTAGVDAYLAETVTDSAGKYQFNNLSPGAYVVSVDAMNFQAGMALEGMKSSTGNGTPSDPDDNVNNDDNGMAIAGGYVMSQAVTLTGGAEPTNDGDALSNTNMTVDFGFYGFDLVLTKDVNKGAVSPNERLTYTVTVTNDGPSEAFDVDFLDTLPPGVSYVSHSVTKSGVSLSHSAGKLTGSLGDMAPGDVIVVTVMADVQASATGVLVNEAEVSAPNEEDTTNNWDDAQNTVVPKIDLQITKTDTKDPVAPGESFSYTLTIKNNGPSDATGVIVKDLLPDVGVSFTSASLTPLSVNGRELLFDLGDMANGATRTITVTVTVAPTFTGTLLNESEVGANEEETNYANNQDDEPTVVQAEPASIGGFVYHDRDDDGVFDAGESPIAGVTMLLTGLDMTGASVSLTTTTLADGSYLFDNLVPGEYNVTQVNQPLRYRDGKDTPGDNGDGVLGTLADGLIAPDTNAEDDRDGDAIGGINVAGGYAARDYNFGELAVNVSKRDFVRRIVYR